jgi:bacterioferritin B
MNKSMVAALNQQIGNEFSAFLQYVAIAAHFSSEALPELSACFSKHAEEEKDHALRIVNFLVEVGAPVVIPLLNVPKPTFDCTEDAIKLSVEGEVLITQQIHALVALAMKENDVTTLNFLQWFVREQLEEVSFMEGLLKVSQRVGKGGSQQMEDHLARQSTANPASLNRQ